MPSPSLLPGLHPVVTRVLKTPVRDSRPFGRSRLIVEFRSRSFDLKGNAAEVELSEHGALIYSMRTAAVRAEPPSTETGPAAGQQETASSQVGADGIDRPTARV